MANREKSPIIPVKMEDKKKSIDKCKDNMIKRRMLFQREQAEKKDLEDTSVNNTMIDGESGL